MTLICEACGGVGHEEAFADGENLCLGCYAEYTAATQRESERVFRADSRDWFGGRASEAVRRELDQRGYERWNAWNRSRAPEDQIDG